MDSRSDSPERYIRILSPPNLLCRYSGMVTICRRGQDRWFPHPVPTSPSLRRCGIPRAGFRGCSWDWGRSTYPRGDVDWDEDPGQCQQCVRRLLGRKHTALSHSPHLSQPQPPPLHTHLFLQAVPNRRCKHVRSQWRPPSTLKTGPCPSQPFISRSIPLPPPHVPWFCYRSSGFWTSPMGKQQTGDPQSHLPAGVMQGWSRKLCSKASNSLFTRA